MFVRWIAFIPTKNEAEEFEKENKLYIDPDECIDCGACEPVCPVEAIFEEAAVPDKWKQFTQIDADWFKSERLKTRLKVLQGLGILSQPFFFPSGTAILNCLQRRIDILARRQCRRGADARSHLHRPPAMRLVSRSVASVIGTDNSGRSQGEHQWSWCLRTNRWKICCRFRGDHAIEAAFESSGEGKR